MTSPMVDAIVTAGGVPQPGDPLYPLTQGRPKALLPIAGRPMVQWVLDAVAGAATIRHVAVIGLTEADAPLTFPRPLGYVPNHGSMIANVEAGVKWLLAQQPDARFVLGVSSDIPALQPAMVDWMVRACLETDHEAYYAMIPHAEMERRFPGSRRSFFRLRDGRFTGSDMNMLQTALVGHYHPAWQAIVDARKNVFKQASLIGPMTLLLFLLGRLSIQEAIERVGKRLSIRGRAIVCPYAEVGMDVDKPNQYELLRRDLEGRQAQGQPA